MKKTLAATLIVLAAVIAAGNFTALFNQQWGWFSKAEAISIKQTVPSLQLTTAGGGGAIAASNPLRVYALVNARPGGVALSEPFLSNNAMSSALLRLDTLIDFDNSFERMRLMSYSFSDPDIAYISQQNNRWDTAHAIRVTAKDKPGSTNLTLNMRGFMCRNNQDHTLIHPIRTQNAGMDPNTSPPSECTNNFYTMVLTNVEHTIPIHVAYGSTVPAQHTITGVNKDIAAAYGDQPEDISSGNPITMFDASIKTNHSGLIPMFARVSNGSLADGDSPTESDRPYVETNFYQRAFEYSLSGTGDNAAFADMLEVETQYAFIGSSDWQPMANISVGDDAALEEGTYTITLTARDNAPGGRVATIPIRIDVSDYRFESADKGDGANVIEDAPLIANTIGDDVGLAQLWNGRHSTSERQLHQIFDRTHATEELRLQRLQVADESIAKVKVRANRNTTNERFNIVALAPGTTTVSLAIKGYVCSDGATPPAYTAPTTTNSGSAAPPTGCASGSDMVIRDAALVVQVWVALREDPTPDFEITGVNVAAGGVFQEMSTTDAVASFEGTVQSNHTGELSLYAYTADGQLVDRDNATVRGQPDRPMVDADFNGRRFTYKLAGADAGAGDDSAAQTARNMALARMLVVQTLFADPDGAPAQHNPIAKISARPGATLPPGTYGLQLTGSDDLTGGGTATMAISLTITAANMPPAVSDDLDRETRGTGDDAVEMPVIELPTISEDRAAEEDADADDVKVIHDFTRYFSDPDNQALSYSLRGAPAGVFRLVTGTAKLIQVGDIEYDDIDADDADNVHTPGVDNSDPKDGDFDDAGDVKPVLQYVFSVVASDGSAEGAIEVTLPITEGAVVSVDTGVEFDEPENNAANLLVGRVIIQQNDEPATLGFKIVENAENPDLYVLLKDADDELIAGPWSGVDRDEIASTEIVEQGTTGAVTVPTFEIVVDAATAGEGENPGELRAPIAGAFDYEKKSSYSLTVIAGAFVQGADRPNRNVVVTITDVNEAPVFGASFDAENDDAFTAPPSAPEYIARLDEGADLGDVVAVHAGADHDERGDPVSAADQDAGQTATLTYSLVEDADDDADTAKTAFTGPFAINKNAAGMPVITVTGALDAEEKASYDLFIRVTDSGGESADAPLTITVRGVNENPYFVAPGANCSPSAKLSELSVATQDENVGAGTVVARYKACDPDGDDVIFELRPALDSAQFTITSTPGEDGSGEATATLSVSSAANLDYETKASYTVEVEVTDNDGGQGQLLQQLDLNNLNDNAPVWQTAPDGDPNSLSVNENTLRGTTLATYIATDADGDPITYTLSGGDASQYQIDANSGVLATLASLDADRGNLSDAFTVTADDSGSTLRGNSGSASVDVSVSINNVDDSISSIRVHQANPVLGTHGDPNTALADRKTTLRATVPEAPTDLPATAGTAVTNFISTGNARWGSVLRIAVLSQSPDAQCGNGNQCVFIDLEGDDSDDKLKLMAYRTASRDNQFIASVMPVQDSAAATPGDGGVYKHTDGGVPQIHVEEEDSLRIKFGNLRDSVVIDNEAPEFTNFLPEHEESLDDDEVDYTFTISDAISGIPDPEDLPDTDGDDNYMSVVGLVSANQCANIPASYTPSRGETDLRRGKSMVANTNLFEGETLWCAGTPEVRTVQDDKDFDEIDNGFDVETTVVLPENRISYVTFIACDAAGNCVAYDPDENDRAEAFAEITVDTVDPTIMFARTGVTWDASDNTYDDDRNYIQVIFDDISDLNPDTIEQDDFVVDGHTVVRVYWYDDPDSGEAGWDNAAGTDTRFDRGNRAYRQIAKSVFLELEEDLLPDATPDVSVVPNGLEDAAGNEQDDDEQEADDWIAPAFTVQSITSPRETTRDNVLVGEDEKVTIMVTSDERISTTKPLVDVNYVNAPAGCVDRNGVITRNRDSSARADCAVSARGASLNSVITKDGTSEWTIVVDKPSATGYYNVYIYGDDRSGQNNRGSEGVAPDKIAADFFEKDGDVNADDAVYFEGDVQLPKPRVVVSGEHAGDTEPEVEQKRPLFIEIDFTSTFSADCDPGDNLSDELNCSAESAEYAEDGFDAVTITKFELDGVDMTDSVKTTDDETFLVALDDVSVGDHEITIQAMDVAGNELKDELDVEFSVDERDPFTRRLNPGWNLVSLPGEPSDGDISAIFTADIEVRTVYTYNPVIPGGWQVAVRETLSDAWQGDLTQITARNGYWVLSDAIQDLDVNIPRLAGGAIGASTPIQPPVIPMYAGWNLIPVVDVTGDALDTDKSIDATTYLNSLDDGLDLARVLGFNTITNEWFTVLDPDTSGASNSLRIGSGYWVFVRESASLVPGGTPR